MSQNHLQIVCVLSLITSTVIDDVRMYGTSRHDDIIRK